MPERESRTTEVPANFREGIAEDGTIEGHVIETWYRPLERLELRNGYLAVISDDGGVDAETRIPLSMLRTILKEFPHADRTLEQLADAARDYLGWQDSTIPDERRASGAAHRMHLIRCVEAAEVWRLQNV